jgi:hypothetical protein
MNLTGSGYSPLAMRIRFKDGIFLWSGVLLLVWRIVCPCREHDATTYICQALEDLNNRCVVHAASPRMQNIHRPILSYSYFHCATHTKSYPDSWQLKAKTVDLPTLGSNLSFLLMDFSHPVFSLP